MLACDSSHQSPYPVTAIRAPGTATATLSARLLGAVTNASIGAEGDDIEMSRARLMLLSLIAVLSVTGILAQTASAKIQFAWLVLLSSTGTNDLLRSGQTREFNINTDGKVSILKGTVAGATTELSSTSAKVEKGAQIIGGIPGTNEETIVFTGVKVLKPLFEGKEACSVNSAGEPVGTVKTVPLVSEIVESQLDHEPLILFMPKAGGVFTEIEFTEKEAECTIKGNTASVSGNILAEPLEPLVHLLSQHLVFEAATKNFLLAGGGALETAGLSLGAKLATFTGLFLQLLSSDEKWGIC
jgi:hypothetical protein